MSDPWIGLAGTLLGAALGALIAHMASGKQRLGAGLQLLGSEMAAIDALFIQYPECGDYFYMGTPCREGDENYGRAMSIARRMLTHFALLLANENKNAVLFGEGIRPLIRHQFAASPLLCRTLLIYMAQFPVNGRELLSIMREALVERLHLMPNDEQTRRLLAEAQSASIGRSGGTPTLVERFDTA